MLRQSVQVPVFVMVEIDVGAGRISHNRCLGRVGQQISGDRQRGLLHRREREGDHLQEPGRTGNRLHPNLHADRDGVANAAPVAGLDRRIFCQATDG